MGMRPGRCGKRLDELKNRGGWLEWAALPSTNETAFDLDADARRQGYP
jgi:hypothetical protein